MDLQDLLSRLLSAKLDVGATGIYWREIIGNGFGLASALLGMRRKVAAWPIGIVGNLLLFTVFIGGALGGPFDTAHKLDLWGQSGRQIFFIITSIYGWWRWNEVRKLNQHGADQPAITPRWATMRERIGLGVFWLVGVLLVQWVFATIGASWPAPRWYFWCDAWIFVGSMIATYAMARGWNEFWLAWIGVDIVGVPLLVHSGYIPTAVLYAFYAVFVIYGFVAWVRATRTERPDLEPEEAAASTG